MIPKLGSTTAFKDKNQLENRHLIAGKISYGLKVQTIESFQSEKYWIIDRWNLETKA